MSISREVPTISASQNISEYLELLLIFYDYVIIAEKDEAVENAP